MTASNVPAVEVRGLVKRYGDRLAVDDLDLIVTQGEVYGFLGPNGAGKTTTMRVLFGLIRPDAGFVRLFGRDPLADVVGALDRVAGFVETPRFYPYLSAARNLTCLAALDDPFARDRIGEALELVELSDRAGDKVGGYSFGMRQRLGIAAALLRDPKLLVLDEPTTGLDPAGQRDMRALVRRLAERGLTVLLSSHHLAEVEELCSRVAIVNSGRVVYEGSTDDLRQATADTYHLRTTDDARALVRCRQHPLVRTVAPTDDGGILVQCAGDVGALTLHLAAEAIGVRSLTPRTTSLEDLFFELTTTGAAQ